MGKNPVLAGFRCEDVPVRDTIQTEKAASIAEKADGCGVLILTI